MSRAFCYGAIAGLCVFAPALPAATINIGNFVWEDEDKDGVQESGEPGKAGVTVQLWNSAKTQLFDSDVTDANGAYALSAPAPGDYRVRVVRQFPGDTFTVKDAGSDDQLDSDINPSGADTGFTDVFTLASNVIAITKIDAGYISDPMRDHNIGDYVFRANSSGTQTGASAQSGVTVQLLDTSGNVLQTTTSAFNGFYSFKAPNGTYRLKFVTPANMVPTPNRNAGGDDNNDSDIDSDGFSHFFTMTTGLVLRNVDAGFVFLVTVGNFVWEDEDKDGLQESGEPGKADITVQLWNAAKTQLFDSAVTNANGAYTIYAPGGGDYRLRVLRQFAGDTFTIKDAGSDDTFDSDINPSGPDSGFSDVFTLGSNVISITRMDAGYISDPMRDHNIGDFVFRANSSGTQTGASALGGITVELLGSHGVVVQTTTSGNDGFYSFKAAAGTYRLRFVSTNAWVPSPHQGAGSDDALDSDIDADGYTASFSLTTGEVIRTLDAGFVTNASIGNFVWEDRDGDGTQEGGEAGIEGITVQLWDAAKTQSLDATVTNSSGGYTLHAPATGSYRVRVLLPFAGARFTTKNASGPSDTQDSDFNATGPDAGFTDAFTIAQNVIGISNIDAGIVLGDFRITNIQRSGFVWTITFVAPVGSSVVIERSSNLEAWEAAASPFTTTTDSTTRSFFVPAGTSRFYWRVKRG